MYELDFTNPVKLHFTGIGGISMSALAEIMLSKNFTISGSDNSESAITNHLKSLGADIHIGQVASNITPDIDVLIYTAAVKQDNPELVAAKEYGIPLLTRAEFLGQMMKNYNVAIGVAGTHGKTTTTSLLSQIMISTELDPTILVGGIMPTIGGNTRIGKSDKMITEACEYTNSFLSFHPSIGIILNIAEDHLDFFKDLDDIRHSFREYAKLIPQDGALIINGDIENLDYIIDGLDCTVITFGTDSVSNNYSAANITFDDFARPSFDLVYNKETITTITLGVTGIHNVYNSLAAIAAAHFMGLDFDSIATGIAQSKGADRRFQYKGKIHGITVIDDYAHHPDEIKATLSTAKKYPHNKTWCVFQPHTYTRTKALLNEFAEVLCTTDNVVLADIYAAREKDTLGISSKDLMNKINELGGNACHFSSFDEIENFLLEKCINDDLVITMGAGDVYKIGEKLIGE